MAKYKKKAPGAGKAIIKVIAMLLLTVIVGGGAAWGTGWALTGTGDIRKWSFGAPTTEPPIDTAVADGSGLIVSTQPNENAPITMRVVTLHPEGLSKAAREQTKVTQPSASYELTVTIRPDTAADLNVIISAEWNDKESEWAAGKEVSEYITITPQGGAANWKKYRIDCLQAFSEQILIKASSAENPEINAVCVCNYLKKVLNPTIKFYNGGGPGYPIEAIENYKLDINGCENWYGIDYTLSEGTLEGKFTLSEEIKFKFLHDMEQNAYYKAFINEVGADNLEFGNGEKTYLCSHTNDHADGGSVDCEGIKTHVTDNLDIYKFLDYYTQGFQIPREAADYYEAAWYLACVGDTPDFRVTLSYKYEYEAAGGGTWLNPAVKYEYTEQLTKEFEADSEWLRKSVESIEIDNDGVIF